ncbi:macrolide 2'-phosphotransferase [Dactylosporangium aurantiacum]|uniref:Macrolide 2'-phosphotransferase n=1 Tax=Dactylosporangium aurantiacum TaxID=35754 RepID=A0A9Q9IAG0_9ACTN|nr:macrolide 2'-phosphotransferase [Dactylosporangium aurantiacum]MDG6106952.1 macrolide 2'-phosphotransferase [Dactylosporangium aurantiacum]UWZ50688.1 macrolide 2'-phosphotransferase [Dactylosporangium aurantiacum]
MSAAEDLLTHLLDLAGRHGLRVRPETARVDDTGWDFVVVHVDGDDGRPWILRAPRRPGAGATVRAEQRLLELLRGRFPVAIPDWRYADETFIAYPRLPGEPAAAEDPVTFELRWRIDRQRPPRHYLLALGQCMARLHATDTHAAAGTGIPVRAPDTIRARFAGHLAFGAAELGMHATWLERGRRWLDDDALWSPRVVLIHGDLHPGHTLVGEDGTLLAVLDWTDAEVGDPGQEFVEAARKFPAHVLDELIGAYVGSGGPSWPGLRGHVVEAIAFAPLALAVLGAEAGQQRYVDKARAVLGVPTAG